MYTVWMVIYRNSNVNIVIFWDADFLLSLAVRLTDNENPKISVYEFRWIYYSSKLKKKNIWSVLLYM